MVVLIKYYEMDNEGPRTKKVELNLPASRLNLKPEWYFIIDQI